MLDRALGARRLRHALAALAIGLAPFGALALDIGPPDTSSPRATTQSFIDLTHALTERYDAYRKNPGPETQRAFTRTIDRGQYLMDLSEVAPSARREVAPDAVAQLWDLSARAELPPLDEVPDASAFGPDGPLTHQPAKWQLPGTGIVIKRVDKGARSGEFLISAETVASLDRYIEATRERPYVHAQPVADLYETLLHFSGWMLPPQLIEQLPDWMRIKFAGQVLWKWILMLLSLTLASLLVVVTWRWSRMRDWDGRALTLIRRITTPLVLLVLVYVLRKFLDQQVHTTGIAIAFPDYLTEIGASVGAIWIVLLVTAWVPSAAINSTRISAKSLDASLVRLLSRVVAVVAVLALGFSAAHDLGIPVFGLIAGAGVGGLAIALAARPTLANFIGALNLIADRPIRVGDLCRFDERHGQGWNPVGTVDAIGLRSTRIRQFDGSVITIPNADLAERNIVNLSACETFLLQQRFALRYETSDDQLRYVLGKLRELLHGHPKTIHTAGDPIRARFLGFRDHELAIELRAYIRTTVYSDFLAIQEDIMLRVMKLVKQSGTGFALPSQTLYLSRYEGLDDDGRAAAEKRVREWASALELPFPDLDEEHRKRITDTLDYPPEGSPGADRG